MTQAIATRERGNGESGGQIMERVLLSGDLSKLTSDDRLRYYTEVCNSLGLNPLTQPFAYITLNNKLTLYARKDCTDQLRTVRKVSIKGLRAERMGELYVVTARAETPDGRQDEEIGAVNVLNLRGDALANAMMKATTKAKRRVTLSLCGLGMLDETEVESISSDQKREFVDDPDAVFRREWIEAVEERGATAQQAETLLSGLLRQGKKFLEDLDEHARDAILTRLREGKYDAYLRPPEKKAATDPDTSGVEAEPPTSEQAVYPEAVQTSGQAADPSFDIEVREQAIRGAKAEWAKFAVTAEARAKAAKLDVEPFERGWKKWIVATGCKGKEHLIPQAKRDDLLAAIDGRQGFFA